jgi:hypothetical protein
MRRTCRTAWLGTLALLAAGCASGPLVGEPAPALPATVVYAENPVYLPQGGHYYNDVFERILDVVDDYFEVAYANRYDGRIETFPRVAPGFEQPWKPGSPDFYQRLLATTQTIRQRAMVRIDAAQDGGFFVDVKVYKELEDLPRPLRSTAGSASFRSDNTVERQYEVIDAAVFEAGWIPIGRNLELEAVILQCIKMCL